MSTNEAWARGIIYGAGMQKACSQEVANRVIKISLYLNRKTENTIESCVGITIRRFNKRKLSKFSDELINWLLT